MKSDEEWGLDFNNLKVVGLNSHIKLLENQSHILAIVISNGIKSVIKSKNFMKLTIPFEKWVLPTKKQNSYKFHLIMKNVIKKA